MSESAMPSVGARVAHKNDHAKSAGPVWEVTKVTYDSATPIRLNHAEGHKLNKGLSNEKRDVTKAEFDSDYVAL